MQCYQLNQCCGGGVGGGGGGSGFCSVFLLLLLCHGTPMTHRKIKEFRFIGVTNRAEGGLFVGDCV